MKTAIISIKPEYVKKIFSGEKKWEFRKKRIWADKFLIYETAPTKKSLVSFTPAGLERERPKSFMQKLALTVQG